jgi:hypothetical protein
MKRLKKHRRFQGINLNPYQLSGRITTIGICISWYLHFMDACDIFFK